jgi:putative pre-16S rRNA nuclease
MSDRVARTRPGRALGLDLGSRRIGVAVSDSAGTMAVPLTTVARTGDPERDRRRLAELAVEEDAVVVVVGLPLSLDGRRGPAADAAEAEAEALGEALAAHRIPVEVFDERLTTVSAHRALAAGGARERQRRSVVDRSAAAVMLDAWLAARRVRS